MKQILVLHGLGVNMRGKVKQEIFGKLTLENYNERITDAARQLGLSVEIFHSNHEGVLVDKLYDAHERKIDGVVFNPGAFMTGYPGIVVAVEQVSYPVIEVHVSNPLSRGIVSEVSRVSAAVVAGLGVDGYRCALIGMRALLEGR